MSVRGISSLTTSASHSEDCSNFGYYVLSRVYGASALLFVRGQMKVIEKTLPGQLESFRSWPGVLGFVPLSGAEGIRTPDLLRVMA